MALGFSFHISLFLYHFQMNLKICKQDYFVSRCYSEKIRIPMYIVHYIDAMYDSISSFEHLVIKSY